MPDNRHDMTAKMPAAKSRRLASVDALRGITVAAMLLVNDPGDWGHVFRPLDHAAWNGWTPTDFIFPMFLFLVGVSIALAIVPRREKGGDKPALCRAALWRAGRIIALGILINVLAAWLMPGRDMRWPGVLQRIGVCFAAAGMLAIYLPRRWWPAIIACLLAVYTLVLVAGGPLDPWVNIADRIDTAVFGHYVWDFNPATGQGHDPEGLPSTLGALATTLLGLWAGIRLRGKRIRPLIGAGLVLALAGWALSPWLPINKNLWTPTFVLWTAGWSMLVLVAFHWMMDKQAWPAFGRRFGVNAIAAYAGSEIMQILLPATGAKQWLYGPLSGFITPRAGPYVASLAFAVLFVAFWWIIVWIMDRRRWYLKI